MAHRALHSFSWWFDARSDADEFEDELGRFPHLSSVGAWQSGVPAILSGPSAWTPPARERPQSPELGEQIACRGNTSSPAMAGLKLNLKEDMTLATWTGYASETLDRSSDAQKHWMRGIEIGYFGHSAIS